MYLGVGVGRGDISTPKLGLDKEKRSKHTKIEKFVICPQTLHAFIHDSNPGSAGWTQRMSPILDSSPSQLFGLGNTVTTSLEGRWPSGRADVSEPGGPGFDSSSRQPQVVAYQHWARWITA